MGTSRNQDYPPRLISKLWDAVEVLAWNSGSTAKRRRVIYRDQILDISPREFPEALREQFAQLCTDLRGELAKAQAALKPFGVPASSNFEAAAYINHAAAQRLAKKIVGLCRALAYEDCA